MQQRIVPRRRVLVHRRAPRLARRPEGEEVDVHVLHIGPREKAENLLDHVAGKVRHHVSEGRDDSEEP